MRDSPAEQIQTNHRETEDFHCFKRRMLLDLQQGSVRTFNREEERRREVSEYKLCQRKSTGGENKELILSTGLR